MIARSSNFVWCTALLCAIGASRLPAAAFEIGVGPARVEVSAKSGQRIGQSLEISNIGAAPTEVSLRTLDWSFGENGNVTFHDELLPNSCRTWVTLERSNVKVLAHEKKNFRFQVEPPADAVRGECRFMIAIEGVEPAQRTLLGKGGVGLNLPVNGRIAIPVYVQLNGAMPKFALGELGVHVVNGARTPYVTVSNQGDAHGRLDGSLEAVGADGKEFELVPDGSPVLPGQTRQLSLLPKNTPDGKSVAMVFPIRSKGVIDWDDGSFKINAEFK
jgi:hypothetical protein